MLLEADPQSIPQDHGFELPMAPSRPLYELEAMQLDFTSKPGMYADKAPWPVSNDLSARAYAESSLRVGTSDYQRSENRVALIVGEGSLNTSIVHIPEDTIILPDISSGACSYMRLYVDALRDCATSHSWVEQMSEVWRTHTYQLPETFRGAIEGQARKWTEAGYQHSLLDEQTYQKAHEAAMAKAIVTCHMDITDQKQVRQLAHYLNRSDAKVTFANLTNLMYSNFQLNKLADTLDILPITHYAPILAHFTRLTSKDSQVAPMTRPYFTSDIFFGPNNLRHFDSEQ